MEMSPVIQGTPMGTARNIHGEIKISFMKMMEICKENGHILDDLRGIWDLPLQVSELIDISDLNMVYFSRKLLSL